MRDPDAGYAMQLSRLKDPGNVIATLPSIVVLQDEDTVPGVGIEDHIDSPDEPTLRIRWPRIKIVIVIRKG